MGRTAKVVVTVVAVAIVLTVVFFAPVSYWFTESAGPAGYQSSIPVYRSLGCALTGFGDLYAPGWFGFSLGCSIPVPLPF
ncbi:MAG: hypothetical protein KGI38_04370 [Thaumarchaeota archaeon]|nr:hypothetical protein [Nitrososphaerota archaeon]